MHYERHPESFLGFAFLRRHEHCLLFVLQLDHDPADPERGWAWLTTDPKVIDYIKFWFRNLGYWVLAVAVFAIIISITGFRQGERWAWYSLLYLPIHLGIHMAIFPWLAPILSLLMIITLAGLFLPFRIFFPKSEP